MSIISKKDTLIARDSKGKIRQINIACEWNEKFQMYVITRSSGLHGGKFITQPNIEITKGKVKRTITEQAELEYNSNVKSYLDKGYKKISDLGYTSIDEFDPDKVLSKTNTDQNGVGKPMLCKVLDTSKKTLTDKNWLSSFKLDGVRCFLYYKDGLVKTASRGGQDYDIAATYIRTDPYIISLFKDNPNLILDGEIYRHGWTLNVISGLCRLETLEDRHKELKFHCYDIADETLPFKLRAKKLGEILNNCPTNSKLVIVNHTPVSGLTSIMEQHNKAVSEGYEGLVIRDPDAVYKFGARDNRMLKLKLMTEDSFRIRDIELGLRGVEDMCFVMATRDGKLFKAKPKGDFDLKNYYFNDKSDIIDRMGDVQYFGYSPYGIPLLPVFLNVRYDIIEFS